MNQNQAMHPRRSVVIASLMAMAMMALAAPGRAVSTELKQIALDADPQALDSIFETHDRKRIRWQDSQVMRSFPSFN